jgi:hypothetical protein
VDPNCTTTQSDLINTRVRRIKCDEAKPFVCVSFCVAVHYLYQSLLLSDRPLERGYASKPGSHVFFFSAKHKLTRTNYSALDVLPPVGNVMATDQSIKQTLAMGNRIAKSYPWLPCRRRLLSSSNSQTKYLIRFSTSPTQLLRSSGHSSSSDASQLTNFLNG